MTRFDLTPLFRSTVGFDHLSRVMTAHLKTHPAMAAIHRITSKS